MVSANPPYSYSKMTHFFTSLEKHVPKDRIKMEVKSLGRSLGGNNVPYIKIQKKESSPDKPNIVILGRQHSGEVWSSFVLEDFLI